MLKVESISCAIKGYTLVKDLTFTVRPGEVLAVLGSNGAGKSTLMKLLSGEYKLTRGSITLNQRPLKEYQPAALARTKAMLCQQNAIHMDFLCHEIVMMGRYPHHQQQPTLNDLEIVEETMQICGVEQFRDRSFPSLSGGEQQRVHLARTLAQLWDQPDALLLLDEPLAGLDLLYQQHSMAIIRALAQKGFMVVTVLHELNLAAQYADRILMMKNGRRWCDGTPCEVLNPLNIYSVFGIEAEVIIHPSTLTPYIVASEIRLDAQDFNSKLSTSRFISGKPSGRAQQLTAD